VTDPDTTVAILSLVLTPVQLSKLLLGNTYTKLIRTTVLLPNHHAHLCSFARTGCSKVLHECDCSLCFAQCHSKFAAACCIFVSNVAGSPPTFAKLYCSCCVTHAGCRPSRIVMTNLHTRCGVFSVSLQQVSYWQHCRELAADDMHGPCALFCGQSVLSTVYRAT